MTLNQRVEGSSPLAPTIISMSYERRLRCLPRQWSSVFQVRFPFSFGAGRANLQNYGANTPKSAPTAFRLPPILGLCFGGRLPLEVLDSIGSAASERPDVILDVYPGHGPVVRPVEGRGCCRVAVRSAPTAIVVIYKIQLRRLSAWLVSLGFLPTLKIAYLIKDHYSRIFRLLV
jgi:hypothetical protein